jgi:hypothetical protein
MSSACCTESTEDILVAPGSGASGSAGLCKSFVISAANILQALIGVSYLMRADADDSDKVRMYANLVEEKSQALSDLMRPILWNPT